MNVNYKQNQDGSLDIMINFSSMEVNCLMHDLPGIQGIVEWYSKGPSSEKIYRCKERMEKEAIPMLRAKGLSVPARDEDLHAMILAQPEYKNREKREKEAKDKAPQA